MKFQLVTTHCSAVVCLALAGGPARADTAPDFYRGKTITIQVGYGPGGGYDVTTRVVAQFFGDHIAGQPKVVVQNVPGAGSLKVANAIALNTPNDGLTLGVFAFDVALQPYYGDPQARFDPAAFAWIGSMDTDNPYCGVWNGAGIGLKSLNDVVKSPKTLSFGSSAPGALPSVYPQFLKNALGAPIKVIYGFPGTKEVVLAMRRGEVDGACGLFESLLRSAYAEDIKSGELQIFMQSASEEPSPLFPDASSILSALNTDELRKAAQLVFLPVTVTRPLVAPPRTPVDRVAVLRRALLDTTRDPRAIAFAEKINISLQAKGAEEIESVIATFKAAPPELLKKAFALSREP
ncbi:MAG: Tripartite-type tricarboxylate transporter, receptor component TctC [Hyphomicrobiales bacterium]|nr:Tripartite-type tricarboxylate transporter, receptor component TctC [Hyphomicrobiales bacterium]